MAKRTADKTKTKTTRRRKAATGGGRGRRRLEAAGEPPPPNELVLCAEGNVLPAVEICEAEAAADGGKPRLRTFSMTAYTGRQMTLAGWLRPVVVDLAGLRATRPVTVLKDHDRGQVVGHAPDVEVGESVLKVAGVVSGAGDAAREVGEASDNGFPWRASVGVSVDEFEFVAEGQTAAANGRTFKGPLYIARKGRLGEVSFVSVGADERTRTKVSKLAAEAAQDGGGKMTFEKWLEAGGLADATDEQKVFLKERWQAEKDAKEAEAAGGAEPAEGGKRVEVRAEAETSEPVNVTAAVETALAGERKRVADIEAACAGFDGEQVETLRAQARDGEITLPQLQAALLKHVRDSRPTAPAIHIAQAQTSPAILAAAVCMAGGLADVEKDYDEQTLEAAWKNWRGELGLQELLLEAAWQGGYTGRRAVVSAGNLRGVLQAGFSTVDLSGILSNVANKFLLRGFEAVETTWRRIASTRPVKDFKQTTSYRLTGDFKYEKVAADGELKHATAGEESYTNQAETHGKILVVTRQDIINDDMGALTAAPRRLGRGAALQVNHVFWTEFMDNAAFFAAGNNNYASGAATALGINALTAAELLFRDQTDPDGYPLAVTPKILLVPNALAVTGAQLMSSLQLRDTTSSTKYPTNNPHAGKFSVESSSYLGNASYSGYSAKAWHLLADPEDVPVIEVVLLNGKDTPTVESADADFNTLGIQLRGYHDFGVNKQEPRGGVKMKGEN